MGMAEPSMTAKCIAEFVGTFMLVFTVGCAQLTGESDFAGFAIGTVLFVVILCLGGICGGNFNPCVSVSLGLSKTLGGPGMDWRTVEIYCCVQVLAGLLAGACFTLLLGATVNVAPATGFSVFSAGICETLYTFMLSFVVLNVAAASKNIKEKNQYFALAIGFCVVAGAYGAGAVSGGCFNPAVALGLDVSSMRSGFGYSLIYVVFELIGAVLAAVMFKLVRPEDFGGSRSTIQMYLSEFLGVYMLVLTVGLNVNAGASAGALSIAASLTSMIFALGDVSGAHLNPAVTCAVYSSGRDGSLGAGKAFMYMISQLIGGMCAGMTYYIISGTASGVAPGKTYNLTQALIAEFIFTFLISFTVLCVALSPRTKASHFFGLAIGFCVVVGGFSIGNISGGSLNPAVSVGVASVGGGFSNAAAYCVVELLAGAAAATVFKVTHDEELDNEAKSFS